MTTGEHSTTVRGLAKNFSWDPGTFLCRYDFYFVYTSINHISDTRISLRHVTFCMSCTITVVHGTKHNIVNKRYPVTRVRVTAVKANGFVFFFTFGSTWLLLSISILAIVSCVLKKKIARIKRFAHNDAVTLKINKYLCTYIHVYNEQESLQFHSNSSISILCNRYVCIIDARFDLYRKWFSRVKIWFGTRTPCPLYLIL